MSDSKIYLGNTPIKMENRPVEGCYVNIETEKFYKISNYDQIRPFFMSLVSHSDHWLFISSTGGLSAGRKDEDSALFPYLTDDKISDAAETTGSKTIFQVAKNDKIYLWEPFSTRHEGIYSITRNLYKNIIGNKIIFEEINNDLKLCYKYSWQFSEKYGIIKKSIIQNIDDKKVELEMLDGIQNILPYGISADLQSGRSNLANSYKKNELDVESGLGMFLLSSMIVDKAEPSEALKATTVWNIGLTVNATLLSGLQLERFRQGNSVQTEKDIKAGQGAYFVNGKLKLYPGQIREWYLVAEVNQNHSQVIDLISQLKNKKIQLAKDLVDDIKTDTRNLKKLVGMADGLQLTGDELSTGRHFSNVLFNIMRGGIFEDQYQIEKNDLKKYVASINSKLAVIHADFFDQLEDEMEYRELIRLAEESNSADIFRICYEYLPLSFSRRHGDPSRPWNKFSITSKNEDGTKIKSYEGNWRDIFQNWEALANSFPGYILSMITKFVNASTIDGYNPYRITHEGIDWEVIEPDDPWSYIGYWGDHQIIYLQKLIELAMKFKGDDFVNLLSKPVFVYANVPYRIKSYDDIVKNPQDTIDFDHEKEAVIQNRVAQTGADGKLVFDGHANLIRANLTEKMLVSLLAKLSNFIPEAGIWLNTQRPEWNDANNALVGNGVSMVTLYYMRRYVAFCLGLFSEKANSTFEINNAVAELLHGIFNVFQENKSLLNQRISDENRKLITDELGRLGETYRKRAYAGFDGNTEKILPDHLQEFFRLILMYIDHSIKANKREDGLYHAYNLIRFEGEKLTIDSLYEMLEGQVAVLSAGVLNPEEALSVLDALKNSKIYREDQYSYMLYPDKDLPRFLDKNLIPGSFIEQSKLAKALIEDENTTILQEDGNGDCHFNGTFNNANSLKEALNRLKDSPYSEMVHIEYDAYLEVFEQMFNHKAFTGRSGTFFGFEGLGSIYWHMVSKLLLAVQENIYRAKKTHLGTETIGKMVEHYYEIRAGIGINKSPELYGSFPTDPYSHTPQNKGAQQPGMTGQVKEDIINRWAELGIRVNNSCLSFEPIFLNEKELLGEPSKFDYFDIYGTINSLDIEANALAFTYCQVPIVYTKSNTETVAVLFADGTVETFKGNTLNKKLSPEVFARTGRISQIWVHQPFKFS